MSRTLFLSPPSFDGFDGGAGSRYQARRKLVLFCCLISASLVISARLRAAENLPSKPKLPRYKFEAGQELIYEGSSQFRSGDNTLKTTDLTTFWVTRQNPDGSWHVVARNENDFSQGGSAGRKQEVLGVFDVFADGRVTHASDDDYQERPLTELFFNMPTNEIAAKAGWGQEDKYGDKSIFRLAPSSNPTAGKWVFEKTQKGLFNEIYLSTSTALIYFDAGRGLIEKVESEETQGYGWNGKGAGLAELKSAGQRDLDWITQLEREADILTNAKAAARLALGSTKKGVKLDEAVSAAGKALRDARQKVKLPLVSAQFDAQLAELKESAERLAKRKRDEETVLNKPAAEWQTTDIDGKTHRLADYQGKVVVLDFWYRGCGWCIRAVPQIKEVADHFRDKPVAILGMNTDHEEKDARFVVDKLKLNYPTLKAEGLPEKYEVSGFPTFVVIDQKGIIRARHVALFTNAARRNDQVN